jgi:hypothetical protein
VNLGGVIEQPPVHAPSWRRLIFNRRGLNLGMSEKLVALIHSMGIRFGVGLVEADPSEHGLGVGQAYPRFVLDK